jgi:MFS family permease
LRSAAWNLGYALASLVAGFLIVHYGYAVTFVDFVVFSILAMAVFFGYYSRHPRVRSGELSGALPKWKRLALVGNGFGAEPIPDIQPPAPDGRSEHVDLAEEDTVRQSQ